MKSHEASISLSKPLGLLKNEPTYNKHKYTLKINNNNKFQTVKLKTY